MNHPSQSKIYGALESMARGLSRKYGISVIFQGERAYTDGKKIYIPILSDHLTSDELDDIRAYIYHEVAHCLFTDFAVFGAAHKNSAAAKDLLNYLCDIRIEAEISKVYGGVGTFITALRDKITSKTLASIDRVEPFAAICFYLAEAMRGNHHEALDHHPTLGATMLLLEDKYLNLLKAASSTSEVYDVCLLILGHIDDLADDYNKKHADRQSSGGQDKNQDPTSDQNDERETAGESTDTMESPEETKKSDTSSKATSATQTDETKHKKTKPSSITPASNDESTNDFSSGTIENFIDQTFADIQKRDMESPTRRTNQQAQISSKEALPTTTQFDEIIDLSGDSAFNHQYAEIRAQVLPLAVVVRNKIERALVSRSLERKVTLQKIGKLDRKKMAKFATDPDFLKPFYTIVQADHPSVAVSILVDLSGSMSGNKIKQARLAAATMGEALRALNISFEILGFEAELDERMRVFSDSVKGAHFNRRVMILRHKIFKSFASVSLSGVAAICDGGSNVDGESVMWAARRLSERQEKRKILFVLSDGSPAADGSSELMYDDLKTKIAKIESTGIECIGIGVQTDEVKQFYNSHLVIKSAKSLANECANHLVAILLKRARR